MKKGIIAAMLVLLFGLFSGAWADSKPLSGDVELEKGEWTALARRYPMPYRGPSENPEAPSPEILAHWWDVLGDETLTELVLASLEGNRDIVSARSKFAEARATLGISKSALLPWLDGGTAITRSRTGEDATADQKQVGPRDSYSLAIDASWELDISGGQTQKIKAGAADLQAEYGALHGAWVSLASEVALNYVSLRTLQKRLVVAENNLALQRATVELLQSQYDSGLSDELALSQARYTMEGTRSAIPPLKTSIEEAMNRLAVLVGQVPGSLEERLGEFRPLPKPDLSLLVGIPANALRQRPDIYEAERRLVAQVARKKAAQTDFWPKLNLLGSIGLESLSSARGLSASDGFGFSFGPQLSWPIFHGSAIRDNIRVQTAKEEQALAAYEQTVLAAVADVRDALTAETQERHRNLYLRRAVDAAQTARQVAEDRYGHGLTDFNNVISAQSALLDLEEQHAVSEGEMLANVIRLFKALGGGWAPLAEGEASPPAVAEKALRGVELSDESQAYLEAIRKDLKGKTQP
ncbi:efflux transporter outer membrane subunit [Aminithiophilus ramosus]|uniref:Efflux transporter outer membrane subunit n=1 Tax=Aminithiophilus ramosus TaxID=3029084 RepID=A0A9Q7ACX1_9BACT|nr:efflux transporter outer membrane subunit [Aminithiophilus ramosus]QTX32099.1 efflux transporter outer membrane subunit [Aminithiophilus ramosus]